MSEPKSGNQIRLELEELHSFLTAGGVSEWDVLLAALIERANDGITLIQDARLVYANPRLAEIAGYPLKDLIGKSYLELLHPDFVELVNERYRRRMSGEDTPGVYEAALLSRDGRRVDVEINAGVIPYRGEIADLVFVRDISQRKQAEQELKRIGEFNASIIREANEGIILQDGNGRIFFANPAAAGILGYEPGELEGKHWWDIIPQDQHKRVKSILERRHQGIADRYEMPLLRKDGRRIHALVSGSPRFVEGIFEGVMAVFLDISEKKEAEMRAQRLLEQQLVVNRLALSLGNLTDIEEICKTTDEIVRSLMDADAFIVTLYNAKEKLIKACYTRAYGETFAADEFQAFSLEIPEGHKLQRQALESGKPFYIPNYHTFIQSAQIPPEMDESLTSIHRHLLKLFKLYTQSALAAPIHVGGEAVGVMTIHSRRPDAYSAEDVELFWALANVAGVALQNAILLEGVRQSARQIDRILHTVPAGLLLLDAACKLVMANSPGCEYLTALAKHNERGEITHLGKRKIEDWLKPGRRGNQRRIESRGRIFEVAAHPVSEQDPETSWVLVIRDVTRERQIERRIAEQERLATVGQLAAGIAHDFNNILSSIILYAEITSQSPTVSEQDRERVEVIYRQAMNASELIRQILDFSRASALEKQPLSLRPLVKEQVKIFERTLGDNIHIQVAGMERRCVVYADPMRIQQVMMNLAVNARDAMPEGGTLTIGLDLLNLPSNAPPPLPEMKPGQWVRLTFSDTGVGIKSKHLPHIFEPFYTTKERGRGTGLGLAQVYGIVRQHEGYIEVKSEPGKGSVFTIYLPVFRGDTSSLPKLDTGPLVQGKKETILVVEDNPFIRQALVDSLETLNYHTLTASNGREALEILLQHKPEINLVISDMIMPEMSGLALAREIDQRQLGVPLIMLSGHITGVEIEAMRKSGKIMTIPKPPRLDDLSDAVSRMLSKSFREGI